jgi:hypothetical protein
VGNAAAWCSGAAPLTERIHRRSNGGLCVARVAEVLMRRSLLSAPGLGSLLPTSARDWAHSFPHLHATGLTPSHICTRLGSPLPMPLRQDWAHPCREHACGITGFEYYAHAHVCAGALRRAHVPSDGAASMPYAARNLQPGSTARSVGGRVLLQWRRIAA